eukprot:GILJ01009314.1.p1 GENE.GILJ01009314.1~~GILJ01009314.1.p1  ORF type:complete len:519 (-),score=47.59 GILJ01009314.1:54-1610(-)
MGCCPLWSYRSRGSLIATTFCVTLALFIDQLNYGLLIPTFPSLLNSRGFTQEDIGFLTSCFGAGVLIGAPLSGPLADWGKVRTLLGSLLLLIVSTLLFGFYESYHVMVIARVLQGVSDAGVWTSGLALLASIAPPGRMGFLMGITMSGTSLGVMAGPPVGGFLFQHTNEQLPFFVSAASAAVVFLLTLFLVGPSSKGPPSTSMPINSQRYTSVISSRYTSLADSEVSASYFSPSLQPPAHTFEIYRGGANSSDTSGIVGTRGYFSDMFRPLRDFDICLVSGVVAVCNMLLASLEPILPLYLSSQFEFDTMSIGLMFLCRTISYSLFAPLAGRFSDRWKRDTTILVGLFIGAMSGVFLFLPLSLWTLLAFLVTLGAGIAIAETPALAEQALLLETRYPSMSGTGYGLVTVFFALAYLTGPILSGFISVRIGFRLTVLVFCSLLLAYIPVLICRNRFKQHQRPDVLLQDDVMQPKSSHAEPSVYAFGIIGNNRQLSSATFSSSAMSSLHRTESRRFSEHF